MLTETVIQDALVASCTALLLYAALHDVVGRTVPNLVSLLLIGVGLVRAAVAHTIAPSMLVVGAVFAVALLVWRAGLLGGGDVKLLTAACLVVPPREAPVLLVSIAIVGGLLGFTYVIAKRIAPVTLPRRPSNILRRVIRVELWRMHRGGPLPYAVAIAVGTMTRLVGH